MTTPTKKDKLDFLENITIKIILVSAILIIVGILFSVLHKGIAFWMISISSCILFFSIFLLIIIIFLKEFKTK